MLKLQSGVKGLFARKNVWVTGSGGRPINEGDMATGLGEQGLLATFGHNQNFWHT